MGYQVYIIYEDNSEFGGYAKQLCLSDDFEEVERAFYETIEEYKESLGEFDDDDYDNYAQYYYLALLSIDYNDTTKELIYQLEDCVDEAHGDLCFNIINRLWRAGYIEEIDRN